MKRLIPPFHITFFITSLIFVMQFTQIWWFENRVFASLILGLNILGFVIAAFQDSGRVRKQLARLFQGEDDVHHIT